LPSSRRQIILCKKSVGCLGEAEELGTLCGLLSMDFPQPLDLEDSCMAYRLSLQIVSQTQYTCKNLTLPIKCASPNSRSTSVPLEYPLQLPSLPFLVISYYKHETDENLSNGEHKLEVWLLNLGAESKPKLSFTIDMNEM
jgi:hypothetical protein